jgi:hypothetical protein
MFLNRRAAVSQRLRTTGLDDWKGTRGESESNLLYEGDVGVGVDLWL